MMRNRQGISPLIATVLLLAFAVAIGTMVVSYLVDATRTEPCDRAVLTLQEGVPVCQQNGRVAFIITNRGEETLVSTLVTFISPNADPEERRAAIALASGSSTRLDFPFDAPLPSLARITIVPSIIEDGREKYCFAQEVQTQLQAC